MQSLVQRHNFAMGTFVLLTVPNDRFAYMVDTVFSEVMDQFYSIEKEFSPFEPTSSLCKFNNGDLSLTDYSDRFLEVFELADNLRIFSNGSFNPFPEGVYDPIGVVKGWAIDKAVTQIREFGLENFVINVGGDLFASGYQDDSFRGWFVGIQDPCQESEFITTISISNRAVATSGQYAQLGHIRDCVNDDLQSVTVIGPDTTTTDAFATAAFSMGMNGVNWISQHHDFDVIAISDTDVHSTCSLLS